MPRFEDEFDAPTERQPELVPKPEDKPVVIRKVPKKRGRKFTRPDNPQLHDIPVTSFYEKVDHEELNEALTWAGNAEEIADPKWLQLQYMMAQPANRRTKFSTLCKRLDIRMPDLIDFWRNWKLQQGTIAMLDQLPRVMSDVAHDSRSKIYDCPECDGTGAVPGPETTEEKEDKIIITRTEKLCPKCYGQGKVRIYGDRHSRDQLFEIAGLTKKEKGKQPMVAIQQNFGSGELPDTTRKVSAILEDE